MATRTTPSANDRDAPRNPRGQQPSRAGLAAGDRNLVRLSPEECFSLVEAGGVGRVGFASADGIEILPVNFAVEHKRVIFRTAPDTLLAAYAHAPVSFETDHLDPENHQGWSVLIQGHAHKISGEQEIARLEHDTSLVPWAAGARDVWVRITPTRISGRRV
jgi:nitroimidazol reductase NimA-like FMN-containing flavoprotein (pyridoxamine 5'-phosphate oxidase superfamily)